MEAEKFVVAKPFNTVNRRLQVGEVVTDRDIRATDTQMLFAERRAGGFLVGYDTKAAEKAAAKARAADAPLTSESPDPSPSPMTDQPSLEPDLPAEPEMKRPSRR